MDELLITLSKAAVAAFLASIATEIVKRSIPGKYHKWDFFPLVLNLTTVVLAFVIVWVLQTVGWIDTGSSWLILSGIVASGLAVLGFETVKNIGNGVGLKQKIAAAPGAQDT